MSAFQVRFSLTSKGKHVIGTVNTYGLDLIRDVSQTVEKEGCENDNFLDRWVSKLWCKNPDVDNTTVNFQCPVGNTSIYDLSVPGSMIELIPQFRGTTTARVVVSPGFLGRYMKMQIVKEYKNPILMIRPQYRVTFALDDVSLLNDWITSGCPSIWSGDAGSVVPVDYYMYQITRTNRHKYDNEEVDKVMGANVDDAIHSLWVRDHYKNGSEISAYVKFKESIIEIARLPDPPTPDIPPDIEE